MPARVGGALVARYARDVPADPGGSQPWRHRADAPGGGVTRDDAPQGGGWQPDTWGTLDAPPVLAGHAGAGGGSHYSAGSHYGADDGAPAPADLDSEDRSSGGVHTPATLLTGGSAGADHGGLRATGVSAPWANPGGLRLGIRYIVNAARHLQTLHFNRPKLRYVRLAQATSSTADASASPGGYSSPFVSSAVLRGAGPATPKLRRVIAPYGQVDYVPQDQDPASTGAYDPGTIGGGWAL